MLKKIIDYFKKEIRLTKEYHQTSELPNPNPSPDCPDEVETTYQDIVCKAPGPISSEDYQQKRQEQIDLVEQYYDFTTAIGINSIPGSRNLIRSAGRDPDVIEYCLRQKSSEYESVEKLDLAILCLKKLNQIRMTYLNCYRKDDYYRLVRLLAQSGNTEEAIAEKARIDTFFDARELDFAREQIKKILDWAEECNTDLVLMEPHGCSCPKCAQFQGRVFSISGRTKQFPKIPGEFFVYGGIHKGCGHTFFPYYDRFTDPMLDYTLTFQTNVAPQYRKNITAFSNRPFVDDRLPEDIEKYEKHAAKLQVELEQQLYYQEHMIEIEAQRGIDKRDYKWLQENLPDICPKSYSGYKRMKNGNTKNYQKLVTRAKELGRDIQ